MRHNRSSVFYGALLLTVSGLFNQALGFFYRIVLSRLIGSQLMGLYQLIMPVYSVLTSVTAVGLTAACSTLSAKYGACHGPGAVRQIRRQCFRLFFLLFVPVALGTAALSDPISVHILGDARTRLGLLLLLPCALLTGVENLQKHCFFGMGRVGPPAFSEMAEQVVRSAAVIGLLLLFLPQNGERTVGLIVLGMGLCEVFSAVLLTLLFHRRVGGGRERPLPPRELRQEIIGVAVPVGGTALLGNLLGSANAILIPQRLVAGGATVAEAMSAFGVVSGMTLPMLLLPSAFIGALGLVLTPSLAKGSALGQGAAVRDRLGRAVAATSILLLPAMTLLAVIGPTLGRLLFREPTVGGYIVPLTVGVVFTGYQSVFASALNGLGKQGPAARNMLLSDGVQLLFTYFLVGRPEIGLAGYAAGVWVSALLGAVLNYRALRKATGLRGQVFCWAVAPGLAALLMGLTGRLLFRRLLDGGVGEGIACLVTGVFSAVLYLVTLRTQGVRLSAVLREEQGE